MELMFDGQRSLMSKYHDIELANGATVLDPDEFGDLNSRRVQQRLHDLYGYVTRELAEAMQELKNKPWKQTERPTDEKAFVDEVGDVAHFFFEFCITAGISPIDLYESYFRMHQKNQVRQSTGY